MEKISRAQSFILIAWIYLLAGLAGVWIYTKLNSPDWVVLLTADLAATIIVWIASVAFKNASVYDPYWSVQPVVILGAILLYTKQYTIGNILLFGLILFWGARLTANWVVSFKGIQFQDWRYSQIQKQTGKFFLLVSLLGIQVMPTLIVYLCVLPGFYYIKNGGGITWLTIVGMMIILSGTLLELVADAQMREIKMKNPDSGKIMRSGVWKHSRHPNYLGEIAVWWGVYLVLLSVQPELWRLGAGALVNTCLFLFISIPMAEEHLAEYKDGYAEYKAETRILLPIPKRISEKQYSDQFTK